MVRTRMHTRFIRQGVTGFGVAIALIPLAYAEPGLTASSLTESAVLAMTGQLAQAPIPATITRVEVISTEPGLDLIIETAQGEALAGTFSTAGNQLIIDIPDAQLAAEPFIQTEPTEGIASVEAIALTDNQVQVRITGLDAPPTGEIVSTANGLTLSVVAPVAAIADMHPHNLTGISVDG